MGGKLSDGYITTSMIADAWNKEEYRTINGRTWTADNVRSKFDTIMSDLEKYNTESEPIKPLFRSENGEGRDTPYIFFDSTDIADYRERIYRKEYLGESTKLLEEKPMYMEEYKHDTATSMKQIFSIYDKYGGGIEYLDCEELKEFIENMKALIPHHRNLNDLSQVLHKISALDEKEQEEMVVDLIEKLEGGWRKDQDKVERFIKKAYLSMRRGLFFRKRIFVEKYYYRTEQKDYLLDWKRRWTFVIDRMIQIMVEIADNNSSAEEKYTYDAEGMIQVFLIWYQNDRWEKTVLSDNVSVAIKNAVNGIAKKRAKSLKDEINTKVGKILKSFSTGNYDIRGDKTGFIYDTKSLVDDMFCYRKNEISDDKIQFILDNYMLDDLLYIHKMVSKEKDNIDAIKQNENMDVNYKTDENPKLLTFVEKAMEIMMLNK